MTTHETTATTATTAPTVTDRYVDYVAEHGDLEDGWYVLEDRRNADHSEDYGFAAAGPFVSEPLAQARRRTMDEAAPARRDEPACGGRCRVHRHSFTSTADCRLD